MKYSVLLVMLVLMLQTTFAQNKPVRLKIATVVPEGSSWVKCMREISKEAKSKMNIELVIYPGGILGDANSTLDQIKYNKIDGGGFMGSTISNMCTKLRIFDLPHKYRNIDEWKYVFKKIRKEISQELEKNNLIVLGWSYGGFVDLYSKAPIRTLQDFQKAKVWFSPGDPLMDSLFRKMEIHGVPMTTTNTFSALQTGLINCVYNTPYGVMAMQWHTNVKFRTRYPIVNAMGAVVVTKKSFEKIPPQYRKLFLSICNKHFQKLAGEIEQQNIKAEEVLEKRFHIKTIEPDEHWKHISEKIGNEIAEEQINKLYSKEFYKRIEGYLKEYRENKK